MFQEREEGSNLGGMTHTISECDLIVYLGLFSDLGRRLFTNNTLEQLDFPVDVQIISMNGIESSRNYVLPVTICAFVVPTSIFYTTASLQAH